MQLIQLCFYSGRPFEETHENSLWRLTDGRTDGLTEVFHEALADLKNIRVYQVYFVISKIYTPNEMPEKSLEIQASEKFQEFWISWTDIYIQAKKREQNLLQIKLGTASRAALPPLNVVHGEAGGCQSPPSVNPTLSRASTELRNSQWLNTTRFHNLKKTHHQTNQQ